MRECLDEGILQSYFDGELSRDQMESATSHLAACSSCSATARELEGEISLVSTALAHEFDSAVPSERLRQRIDAAVADAQLASRARSKAHSSSVRSWLQSLSALLAFTPQQSFGYAALVVVVSFAAIFGIIQWRQTPPSQAPANVAVEATPGNPAVKPVGGSANTSVAVAPKVANAQNPLEIQKAGLVSRKVRPVRPRAADANQTVAQVKLLPGERSYLKTIAALDSTIKGNGRRPMTPSLQAEYERNLALVDRALAATRSAAKKNPNDPEAAEFMFTAYESKVNLLNTVADARVYNRQQ
jgi:anti-sigma factor RsiW